MILKTILSALLWLLKIAGILLLAVLAAALAALLFVLFVPVRYRVSGFQEEAVENGEKPAFRMELQASWLLKLFRFRLQYGKEGLAYRFFIAWLEPLKLLAGRRERKARKAEKQKTEPEKTGSGKAEADRPADNERKADETDSETVEPEKTEPEKTESQKTEPEKPELPKTEPEKTEPEKKESAGSGKIKPDLEEKKPEDHKRKKKKPKKAEPKKEKRKKRGSGRQRKQKKSAGEESKTAKLREKARNLHAQVTDEGNRRAGLHAWTELCYLLGHYKPNRLKADIAFSLGDPALTGEALGALSLTPFVYRYPCHITPDFSAETFYIRGNVHMRGKVAVWRFALSAWRLYRDKELRRLLRQLQGG